MSTEAACELNTKPRMIDDLIPLVLESDDHWWPRDFQRLALVSSGWVGPIRRRLYACPSLRTFRACNLLRRTLAENPHLLSLIHGIDLRPVTSLSSERISPDDMTSLRFILNIGGLKSVTLGGELAMRAEMFIHMMSKTRSITSLHIDGSHFHRDSEEYACTEPASLEWDEKMAFAFSRLQTLRLTDLQLGIGYASRPYVLNLSNIILDDVSISFGEIQHLCNESWGSVRHLTVTAKSTQDSDDMVRELLECCENLETLRYEVCGARANGDIFQDDVSLPALTDIRLFDVDINPQMLVTLSQNCENLKQLSVLGRTVRLTPQDWSQFIQSGVMPSLQTLRTASGTNYPPYTPWSQDMRQQISNSCSAKGISLVCSP